MSVLDAILEELVKRHIQELIERYGYDGLKERWERMEAMGEHA